MPLCMDVSVRPLNTIQNPNQSIPESPKVGTVVPVKVLLSSSVVIFRFLNHTLVILVG
jgi:hypothetical protein